MKVATTQNLQEKVPETYRELMAFYPVRPIRDDSEYDSAVDVAEWISGLQRMNPDQEDYFDLLTDQIEKYDREHYLADIPTSDPIDLLSHLLNENSMNDSDLG